MKNAAIFLIYFVAINASGQLANDGTSESRYEQLMFEGVPSPILYLGGGNTVEINGKSYGDKKLAKKEATRLVRTFAPNLPVTIVVRPNVSAAEILDWIQVCSAFSGTYIRIYVAESMAWNAHPMFDKSRWWDICKITPLQHDAPELRLQK